MASARAVGLADGGRFRVRDRRCRAPGPARASRRRPEGSRGRDRSHPIPAHRAGNRIGRGAPRTPRPGRQHPEPAGPPGLDPVERGRRADRGGPCTQRGHPGIPVDTGTPPGVGHRVFRLRRMGRPGGDGAGRGHDPGVGGRDVGRCGACLRPVGRRAAGSAPHVVEPGSRNGPRALLQESRGIGPPTERTEFERAVTRRFPSRACPADRHRSQNDRAP